MLRDDNPCYERVCPVRTDQEFRANFVPYGLFSPKSESEEILDSVSKECEDVI